MKRRKLRLMTVVIGAIMSVSMLGGCGSAKTNPTKTGTNVSKDFVTLNVLYPGEASPRMQEFLDNEFKKKMKSELNLEVKISFIGWDQYFTKKDMMIAAGQEIDWYWDGMPDFSKVVAKKSAMPLDDLLKNYGKDLMKAIPAENFKTSTANGKIMAIPSQNAPTSDKFRSILVRQDILESVGMKSIKSVDDLDQYLKLAKAKNPDMKGLAEDLTTTLIRQYQPGLTMNDIVTYDEISKKVVNEYETEGWKQAVKKQGQWAKEGFISDEVTIKPTAANTDTGLYLVQSGAISRPMENINNLHKNVPTGKYAEYLLAPDKPSYKWLASTEMICIGSTSKYPERTMQFLNWMYKSADNYNFLLYGVKDKDYKIEGDKIKPLTNDSFFSEWMFRNINIMTFPTTVDDTFIKTFKNWDKDARTSGLYGFQFDITPVSVEDAKLRSVVAEKIKPIQTGYVDFDKYYPAALKALKAAGIDKYNAEYQKQLDAYQASHK